MTSIARRVRRTAAIAVALAAGSGLALTGTAAAGAGHPSGSAKASATGSAPINTGLYQSAYSERNHALWVTSSVGRPPVTRSALTKVDARTLTVEETYTPPVTDEATGAVEAVYGVDVDDRHNTVWTTNTRDNTVSVYSQRTGKHLATLPDVNHAREIKVDERHNLAWTSSFGDGGIVAFDTRTYKEKKRFTVEGATPAGIAVNERTGTAYATDIAGDQIIEVTAGSKSPRLIPAGDGPISVSLSKDGRTAYTADQEGGSLSVVDLRKGAVRETVPTGEGALSVATDPRSGNALVVNRTPGTVSVVDTRKGAVVKTLETGANPNHIQVAGGSAWVVDKSGSGAEGQDLLHRFGLGR
ncbi:YncE family protein [Streptomyces tsukubensis]|uniref:YncE family protein n=1 Tax=Streptomyces tsukubensis TaxID=83656 RepID=A0A1V4AA15_9ACTN|nr:YncE family protein [Streptomyces tsukubensis]OON79642.1 hypothetical protein B1H18_13815 [Streptomyces tsukubensis]QFR95828.1 YncE family protein [Streptomyces tsukubensis]